MAALEKAGLLGPRISVIKEMQTFHDCCFYKDEHDSSTCFGNLQPPTALSQNRTESCPGNIRPPAESGPSCLAPYLTRGLTSSSGGPTTWQRDRGLP